MLDTRKPVLTTGSTWVPDAGISILHWFSGTVSELTAAIDFGCWFSVGLPMLRSKKGQALVTFREIEC